MNERVTTLDGFRFVAITLVIVYHYCYRFAPPFTTENFYPYVFRPTVFQYGFYGVQLFFVISGFVIFKTLESTQTFSSFFKKRLVRLWPALLVCSVITYGATFVMDADYLFPFFHTSTVLCFIPSLTMTTPAIWNFILQRTDLMYIDGVHWSLFTEMVFYVLVSIAYFLRPGSFLKNWSIFVFVTTAVRVITTPKLSFLFPESVNTIFSIVYQYYFWLTLNHLVYFSVGILFYHRYSTGGYSRLSLVLIGFLCVLEFYFVGDNVLRVFLLIIISAFLMLIYRANWLKILGHKYIAWVGMVSYPLYLLHENIGIMLIKNLSLLAGPIVAPAFLPLMVTLLMVILASIVFMYVEKPASAFFRRRLKLNSEVR
jgi:peptidoglycan/LPS O-acetylase OafA/YrhL